MPTYEPFDWYETPVYYDIIFDADTGKQAAFLEQCHAKHAQPAPPPMPTPSRSDTVRSNPLTILEPACGTGRLMAEFAARGHRVAGVDLSEGMLHFARKRFKDRCVRGSVLKAPMQGFDLHDFPKKQPGFDLAHILVSSFKYLQTEDDAAACLRCVCDHLRVGGIFVLGVHIADPDETGNTLERWRARRDNLDVICTIRSSPPDLKGRTEHLRSRIVARDISTPGAEPKRYESNWTFRTYTGRQLKSLLRKEPRLKHVGTYTFHHDINTPTTLDGDDLGLVLILRREQ